ncbi:MAG TPA: ABC transporter ATP-binding protein, partial [Chryseosolibacter sp.]
MKQKSRISIRHVFKTIIWPRKKFVLTGLVLIIISRLAGLVLPGATKYLMDDVIAKQDLQMLKYLLIAVVAAIVIQAGT